MKQVHDPLVSWISDRWLTGEANFDSSQHAFGLLRIPFDHAVSYRPGARFGPERIMTALNELSAYCTDKRVSLDPAYFYDLGEIEISHSLPATYRVIEETVSNIPNAVQPILLGGDHSITDPIIRGLQQRAPAIKLGLVVFDAHFDSRTPIEGREHSGHWMKTLGNTIDYTAVAQIGVSAAIYSREYMEMAETNGILVRTPYDIRRRGWSRTTHEVLEHVTHTTDAVYISVDIDCVDKAFAPGTSCVSTGGLLPHDVMDAVFEISKSTPIAGLDVVEISPPLDHLDHTSQLGAHIILNHVAGIVARLNVANSKKSNL